MIQLLKNIFGFGPKVDLIEVIRKGGVILDVRTQGEFRSGHIKGSLNIPVQDLDRNLSKLGKDKPIITCCASGMRSKEAKRILKSNGFAEVHNGGSWMSLQSKVF
ncbi:MAG: rhodanese-like domain-containing protein [Chitinophagales bacterium]